MKLNMKNAAFTEYTEATEAVLDSLMKPFDWFEETFSDWDSAENVAKRAADAIVTEKKNSTAKEDAEKAEQYLRSVTCKRCGGNGKISAYNHVSNGTCFGCMGRGFSGPVAKYDAANEAKRYYRLMILD